MGDYSTEYSPERENTGNGKKLYWVFKLTQEDIYIWLKAG